LEVTLSGHQVDELSRDISSRGFQRLRQNLTASTGLWSTDSCLTRVTRLAEDVFTHLEQAFWILELREGDLRDVHGFPVRVDSGENSVIVERKTCDRSSRVTILKRFIRFRCGTELSDRVAVSTGFLIFTEVKRNFLILFRRSDEIKRVLFDFLFEKVTVGIEGQISFGLFGGFAWFSAWNFFPFRRGSRLPDAVVLLL